METAQIINETGKLPVYKQMIIVEHIIRSIRHTEQDKTLKWRQNVYITTIKMIQN